jgi:hypothetical protein
MFFDDHPPPHFHAEHQGEKAVFDFRGNILRGDISSRTAVRLIREWIDLHQAELDKNWKQMEAGKELQRIEPLK